MPKRRLVESNEELLCSAKSKRRCLSHHDHLSTLSDELILRILSNLSLSDLTLCERLSRKFKILSGDGQIWKAWYYERFVRPRALQIPGSRIDLAPPGEYQEFSAHKLNWLSDEKLVANGIKTNWKRQYKLRHNWAGGIARISEQEIAERPAVSPLLVRLYKNTVILADSFHGIRALSLDGSERLLAATRLSANKDEDISPPTAIALSAHEEEGLEDIDIVVGKLDGSFEVLRFQPTLERFCQVYSQQSKTAFGISAIAYSAPYVLTMTTEPRISLYAFQTGKHPQLRAPTLLSSLKAYTAYCPVSLALRRNRSNIVASMAYAMPTFSARWTVGLQEMRLDERGTVLDSRSASASPVAPLVDLMRLRNQSLAKRLPSSSLHEASRDLNSFPSTKPASLSYNHPYLLTTHPNNTMTLYLVTSTNDMLYVGPGTVLWGHTSSISGAHVGERGKAVSASTKGNELRIWELEGKEDSRTHSKRRSSPAHKSIKIRDADKERESQPIANPSSALSQSVPHEEVSKGWITFDEERVILLREKTHGAQALVVYDFT